MIVTAKEAGPSVRPIAVAQLRNDVEGKATVDALRRAPSIVKRNPEVQLATGACEFESRPKDFFLEQAGEGVSGLSSGLSRCSMCRRLYASKRGGGSLSPGPESS